MRARAFSLIIFLAAVLGGSLLLILEAGSSSGETPPIQKETVQAAAAVPLSRPTSAPAKIAVVLADNPIVAAAPAAPAGRGIIGEWTGPAPVSLWQIAREQSEQNAPPATRIPLRLTASRRGVMCIDSYCATEDDGGVFTGTLEGHSGSTVILSFIGNAQAGVVLIPAEHRAFNFRAGDDGILRVTELETLNAPDCGNVGSMLPTPRV